MTSFPIAQGGLSNMSSIQPTISHQPAPLPNMEGHGAIPAKRGPEDEVQFVSAKPVKRRCGSRESPSAQTQHQTEASGAHNPPGLVADTTAAVDHPSSAGMGPTSVEPQTQLPMSRPGPYTMCRGVSLSAMEKYIFPPSQLALPTQTSRSSPGLSPKQLPPPAILPNQTQTMAPVLPGLPPAAASGIGGSMLPPQNMTWGIPRMVHPHNQLGHDMLLNRPIILPPVQQPPGHEQQHPGIQDDDEQPLSWRHTARKPEPFQNPVTAYREVQKSPMEGPQVSPQKSPKKPPGLSTTPGLQSSESQSEYQPVHSSSQPAPSQTSPSVVPNLEPQPAAQAQTSSQEGGRSSVLMPVPQQQQQPSKPSCMICEQMRQQALFNHVNGFPIGQIPPNMQHSWQGLGPAQPLHMPPPPHPGFAIGPGMHQSFQPRFQAMSHGCVSHGPVPMVYALPPQAAAQIPFQRMMLPEPSQVEPSSRPNPQANTANMSNLATGIVSQAPSVAYMQAQVPPQQQAVASRSVAIPPQASSPPHPPPSPAVPPRSQPSASPQPRKPSPNLIVDIAETCEDLFPWDEVAQRHNVPRQKVVETFGAIIQLPLLRCTTDKKRHGKLATSRLREYTKSKKDLDTAGPSTTPTPTPAVQTSTPGLAPVAPMNSTPYYQETPILPSVTEVAGSMPYFGLATNLTNGLARPWQQ